MRSFSKFLILSFTALIIVSGCSEEPTKPKKNQEEEPEKFESNYSKIEEHFEEISIDQFHVFSWYNFNDADFKFKGIPLT